MRAWAEQPAAVYRQHFIDAIAEQEAAVQRRDARVGERQPLAVQQAPVQRARHCVYSNQSFTVSTAVRQRPPSSTLARVLSGTRATTSSPLRTTYSPTVACSASGAIR